VGIGTTSPTSLLSLSRSTECVIRLTNTGSGSSWVTLEPSSSGAGYIHNISNTPTIFTTNTVERMRIDSSGNVGIGNTPVGKLDVGSTSSSFTDSVIRSSTTGISELRFADTTTNAGFIGYEHTNDAMKFGTAATERMRLDSSGNLGIGISPSYPLHIHAPTGYVYINSSTGTNLVRYSANNTGGSFQFGIDNSTGSNYFGATPYGRAVFSDGAYPVGIFTNGLERMRIDSSGNVGIGVSPATATTSNIQSSGDITLYGSSRGFLGNLYYQSAWKYAGTGYGWGWIDSGSGNITFQSTAASGTAGGAATLNERMRIDSSGNLLVGTTSNSQTSRMVIAAPSSGGSWEVLTITNGTSGASAGIQMSAAIGGTAQIYADGTTANTMVFRTNSIERMRIDSNGNTLLGGTQVGQSGLFNTYCSFGSSAYNTQLFNAYASGTSYFIEFLKRVSTTNSTVGSIQYNGTNTLYNTTSDARLKKNIVDAPSALTLINDIKIRSFDWKDSDSHVDYGVVAQELFEVAPSCVSDGDTGDVIEKTWGVDTSVLVPALIKAIQEQQVLIAQLQADVAALQAK
jgi:hypothetical protein